MADHTRIDAMARWLGLFVRPDQLTELRALHCGTKGRTVAGWFDGEHLDLMARQACDLAARAGGVYFVPNPIRPDAQLPGLQRFGLNKCGEARKGDCTEDAHVQCRKWLLIDADPQRPAGTRATEEQKECAWKVIKSAKAVLEDHGYAGGVVSSSGNGWHLCQPVDLPNDDAARELCRRLLLGLQRRCGTEQARVDTSTYNAARIWRIYGTENRKGKR